MFNNGIRIFQKSAMSSVYAAERKRFAIRKKINNSIKSYPVSPWKVRLCNLKH